MRWHFYTLYYYQNNDYPKIGKTLFAFILLNMECNEAVHKYRGLSVCVFFAFGSRLSLSVWL